MKIYRVSSLILTLLIALVLVACGGKSKPAPEPTTAPIPTAEPAQPTEAPPPPTPTEEPAPAGPVAQSSFQDAIDATIQIEAQGSFEDPEFGTQLNVAGRGSGFIIDPSGIAVTNNHVVTGAAFLQVYVQGHDRPLNAKVLGVSECSDLAVIDIEGAGYPFLEWGTTNPKIGTEVYALGYPLGDPQPTLTRGVISKERTSGETNWASINNVLEHDATINPGNSGGPLVTSDGKVVGVNYRGRSQTSQYYAISAKDAIPIVEQLRAGTDLDSIGINGEAVITDDGTPGIWVSSVKSGSPADKVGIKAGDIITRLEGLLLALDGTMADYCDILRSRNATDAMNVEVLRFATQEYLEGQLNGPKLETSFSFAQTVAIPDSPSSGDITTYQDYVGITDDYGAIYVEVPAEWWDVDGSNWLDDDGTILGSSLYASTSIDSFNSDFSTPGMQILASDQFGDTQMYELLDLVDFTNSCDYGGRFDYEDPVYTGQYDLYSDCAGQGSVIIVLAVEPAEKDYTVLLLVQAVTEADLDALDHILNTFIVIGDLPR
ncbi:MAG: trypsin-like peptidase domain-containing protein [Anaerolineae bacterium]|nr:trypsin-like peptidase domain-containing protein [Anaerolineae bacterium]